MTSERGVQSSIGSSGPAASPASTAGLPPGKRTLVAELQQPPAPPAAQAQPAQAAPQPQQQPAGANLAQTGAASPAAGATKPGEAAGFPAARGFSKVTKETISNAPAGSEAWNGTYQWDSKMHLEIEPGHLKVTVRIFTTASDAIRAQWAKAIADKWSGRMDFQILSGAHTGLYPIAVGLEWSAKAADADYTVAPNAPGATADGRAGQGGTISMTGWGTNDTVDVTHEFGHMLGNAEEYFTTNGVDYTQGGKKAGFRDPGAGVMNNPADVPFERHYAQIAQNAGEMLGLAAAAYKVVPHQAGGGLPVPAKADQPKGDFPVPSKDATQAPA